jgi:hypothetical protein
VSDSIEPPNFDGTTVLVLDNGPNSRAVIARILRDDCASVITTSSAESLGGIEEGKELETQFGQSGMVVGTPAKRPVIFPVRFFDRQIINAGKPYTHQTVFIKLPILIAI